MGRRLGTGILDVVPTENGGNGILLNLEINEVCLGPEFRRRTSSFKRKRFPRIKINHSYFKDIIKTSPTYL